jgi:hypothetical protein
VEESGVQFSTKRPPHVSNERLRTTAARRFGSSCNKDARFVPNSPTVFVLPGISLIVCRLRDSRRSTFCSVSAKLASVSICGGKAVEAGDFLRGMRAEKVIAQRLILPARTRPQDSISTLPSAAMPDDGSGRRFKDVPCSECKVLRHHHYRHLGL